MIPTAYDRLLASEGETSDAAMEPLVHTPLAGEFPAETTQRVIRSQFIKARDLASYGVPAYADKFGDPQPVLDEAGIPLTRHSPKTGTAFDSMGTPRSLLHRADGKPPVLGDAYEGAELTTDQKTGAQYKVKPGLPKWRVGTDAGVIKRNEFLAKEKEIRDVAAATGRALSLDEGAYIHGQHEQKSEARALNAILKDDFRTKLPDGIGPKEARAVVSQMYDGAIKESGSATKWFSGGELTEAASRNRATLLSRKAAAIAAIDSMEKRGELLRQQAELIAPQKEMKRRLSEQRLELSLQALEARGVDTTQVRRQIAAQKALREQESTPPIPEAQEQQAPQAPQAVALGGGGNFLTDIGVSLGTGINSVLKMAGDLYGLATGHMDNPVSGFAQENIKWYEGKKSTPLRRLEKDRRAAIDSLPEDDNAGRAWEWLKHTLSSPRLLAAEVVTNAPNAVAGGVAGRVVKTVSAKYLLKSAADDAAKAIALKIANRAGTAGAIGAGAGMQGTDVAGDQYLELIKSLHDMPPAEATAIPEVADLLQRGATLDEAKLALALSQTRKTFGAAAAASIASQFIPGGSQFEKALAGTAGKAATGGVVKRFVKAAAAEAPSEMAEEGLGLAAKNRLAMPVDPERKIGKDVGETLAQSGLLGATMGGVAGLPTAPPPTAPPPTAPPPTAPPPNTNPHLNDEAIQQLRDIGIPEAQVQAMTAEEAAAAVASAMDKQQTGNDTDVVTEKDVAALDDAALDNRITEIGRLAANAPELKPMLDMHVAEKQRRAATATVPEAATAPPASEPAPEQSPQPVDLSGLESSIKASSEQAILAPKPVAHTADDEGPITGRAAYGRQMDVHDATAGLQKQNENTQTQGVQPVQEAPEPVQLPAETKVEPSSQAEVEKPPGAGQVPEPDALAGKAAADEVQAPAEAAPTRAPAAATGREGVTGEKVAAAPAESLEPKEKSVVIRAALESATPVKIADLPGGEKISPYDMPDGPLNMPPTKVPAIKPSADIITALEAIASVEPTRFVLGSVHIAEDKGGKLAIASNGAAIVVVPYRGSLEAGTYSTGRIKGKEPRGGVIEVNYPSWKQVIPNTTPKAKIPLTEDMLSKVYAAYKSSKLVSSLKGIPVAIHFNGEAANFAPGLLLDSIESLKRSGQKKFTLELVGAKEPMVIRGEDGKSIAVLMPVRGISTVVNLNGPADTDTRPQQPAPAPKPGAAPPAAATGREAVETPGEGIGSIYTMQLQGETKWMVQQSDKRGFGGFGDSIHDTEAEAITESTREAQRRSERAALLTSVYPKTDELLGTNERGEKIYWSTNAKTHYTISDGKVRTAPWTEGLPESAIDRLLELSTPAPAPATATATGGEAVTVRAGKPLLKKEEKVLNTIRAGRKAAGQDDSDTGVMRELNELAGIRRNYESQALATAEHYAKPGPLQSESQVANQRRAAAEHAKKASEYEALIAKLKSTQPPQPAPATATGGEGGAAPTPESSDGGFLAEQAGEGMVDGVPVKRVAVSEIVTRPDVMQFKRMIDTATGAAEHHAETIAGEWDDVKAGNLLLWEPLNPAQHGMSSGQKYIVADGHGRFLYSGKTAVKSLNAQVLREADGISANEARTIAAEKNIADGKGTIYDQAKFLRNYAATHGQDAAVARARRSGFQGRNAATIAFSASNSTFDSFVNEVITPEQAAAISAAAPGDESAQRVGMKYALQGKSHPFITNIIKASKAGAEQRGETLDLFGADNSAMLEMERRAELATKIHQGIRDRINSARGAVKRPDIAAGMDVEVRDVGGTRAKIAELERESAEWGENWPLNTELMAKVKAAELAEKSQKQPQPKQPDEPQKQNQPSTEAPQKDGKGNQGAGGQAAQASSDESGDASLVAPQRSKAAEIIRALHGARDDKLIAGEIQEVKSKPGEAGIMVAANGDILIDDAEFERDAANTTEPEKWIAAAHQEASIHQRQFTLVAANLFEKSYQKIWDALIAMHGPAFESAMIRAYGKTGKPQLAAEYERMLIQRRNHPENKGEITEHYIGRPDAVVAILQFVDAAQPEIVENHLAQVETLFADATTASAARPVAEAGEAPTAAPEQPKSRGPPTKKTDAAASKAFEGLFAAKPRTQEHEAEYRAALLAGDDRALRSIAEREDREAWEAARAEQSDRPWTPEELRRGHRPYMLPYTTPEQAADIPAGKPIYRTGGAERGARASVAFGPEWKMRRADSLSGGAIVDYEGPRRIVRVSTPSDNRDLRIIEFVGGSEVRVRADVRLAAVASISAASPEIREGILEKERTGRLYAAKPGAKRLRAIRLIATKRALSVHEQSERERLEREEGQAFMAFTPEQSSEDAEALMREQQRADDRAELEQRRAARLVGGSIETQGELMGPPTDGQGNAMLFAAKPKPEEVRDEIYLRAVERGDMETAQRMVDAAAKAAGYDVGPVFHGTDKNFTVFDDRFYGAKTRTGGNYGRGFYFTGRPTAGYDKADWLGSEGKLGSFYLRVNNPAPWREAMVDPVHGKDAGIAAATEKRDELIQKGHDGAIIPGRKNEIGEVVVFSPSQIKSADPVTRDDSGNVIPPSRRFNPATPDIRHSLFSRVAGSGVAMEEPAIRAQLRDKFGLDPKRDAVRVLNEPGGEWDARAIMTGGRIQRIEINAAKISSTKQLERAVFEELSHGFTEDPANAAATKEFMDALTPSETAEIGAEIERLGYDRKDIPYERAAKAQRDLAAAWSRRGVFRRLVGRVLAWARKVGLPMTRLAAERMAVDAAMKTAAGLRAKDAVARRGKTGESETIRESRQQSGGDIPGEPSGPWPAGRDIYGIKNAMVREDRDALGLGEEVARALRLPKQTVDSARRFVAQSPERAERLIAQMESGEEAATDFNQAVLAQLYGAARNALNRLVDDIIATEGTAPRALMAERAAANERAARLADLLAASGTEASHALSIRKVVYGEDYSYAGILRALRADRKGRKVSEKEQKAEEDFAEDASQKYKAAEEAVEAAEEEQRKVSRAEVFADVLKYVEERIAAGAKHEGAKAEMGRAGWDKIDAANLDWGDESGTVLYAAKPGGGDANAPRPLPDATHRIVMDGAVAAIQMGHNTLESFTDKMVSKFGKRIRPYIPHFFPLATSLEALVAVKDKGGKKVPKPKKQKTNEEITSDITDEDGITQELVRSMVANEVMAGAGGGVTGSGDVVLAEAIKNVTEQLQDAQPGITEDEVRDIFTQYGSRKPLSKKPLAVKMRELHRLGQLVSAARDAMQGVSEAKAKEAAGDKSPGLTEPKKSGRERDEATAAVRDAEKARIAAIKKLTEAAAAAGIPLSHTEGAMKSTLDAAKTRMRNAIDDVKREIAAMKRLPQSKRGVNYDAEAAALRDELAELRKQRDTILGPTPRKPLTDEQRIAMLLAAAKRNEAEWNEKLRLAQMGVFTPRTNKLRPITSKELASVKARAAAARAEVEEIKAADSLLQEADRESVLLSQIEALEEKIAAGAPVSAAKQQTADTQAVAALRLRRDELSNRLAEMRKARPFDEAAWLDAAEAQTKAQTEKLRAKLAAGDVMPATKPERPTSPALEKARFERDQARSDIYRERAARIRAGWSPARKALGFMFDLATTSRAVITSADFSAILRQGGFFLFSRPGISLTLIVPMLRAFRSAQKAHAILDAELTAPDAHLFRHRLDLTQADAVSLHHHEEAHMSRWINEPVPKWLRNIPIAGFLIEGGRRFTAASARAYSTFLDLLRIKAFRAFVDTMAKDPKNPTKDELDTIAGFVNIATGRGKFPKKWQGAMVAANTVLFAPKNAVSRFQLLFGQPLYGGTLRTRKLIAKEYARFLAGAAIAITLAVLAQDDDDPPMETDSRSSDFLKVRFGDTRLDLMTGLIQPYVFASRMRAGETKTVAGGIRPLSGDDVKYGGDRRSDVMWRFLRSKLAPIPAVMFDIGDKRNMVNEKVTPGSVAQQLTIPMSFRDIAEAMEENGTPRGVILSMLGLLGAGIDTFNQDKSRARAGMQQDSHSLPPKWQVPVSGMRAAPNKRPVFQGFK